MFYQMIYGTYQMIYRTYQMIYQTAIKFWNKRPAIVRLALHPLASTHCSTNTVVVVY